MRERRSDRLRQKANQPQNNWYLLTGAIIGLVLGLLLAWVISPVKYVDTDPGSLASPYKNEYRRVVALAYAANHDLDRARSRLALVTTGDPAQALAAQVQRMVAENQSPDEARAMAELAAELSKPESARGTPSAQAVAQLTPQEPLNGETPQSEVTETPTLEVDNAIQTPTRVQPTPTPVVTRTPIPTFTARPTATPMRVLNAPFTVKSRSEVCNGSIPTGQIQIQVTDSNNDPLPGVRIVATWKGGEDIFYTGLVPEINPGYADFVMAPGVSYNLKVGEVSDPVSGITIPSCNGGWKMEFHEGE